MLGSELASLHQTFFFWCLPKWRESRVFSVLEIKLLISLGAFGLDTGSFLFQWMLVELFYAYRTLLPRGGHARCSCCMKHVPVYVYPERERSDSAASLLKTQMSSYPVNHVRCEERDRTIMQYRSHFVFMLHIYWAAHSCTLTGLVTQS